jgi:predicted RND superfamily exporter protein
MTRNMGKTDRLARGVLVAPLALILALVAGLGTVVGAILILVAVVMAVTAVVGVCPLYKLIGLSTDRHTVAPR